MHACMHTCTRTYTHRYIHTYVHIYGQSSQKKEIQAAEDRDEAFHVRDPQKPIEEQIWAKIEKDKTKEA